MKKLFGLLLLVGVLVGCGATPTPTDIPPTQTPWIIVVTATPGPESMAEIQPTQTPWVIVATPTPKPKKKPSAIPTEQATGSAELTAEPSATAQVTATVVEATSEPSRATPTDQPEPGALKYPAPELKDPPSGRSVGWRDTITLVWSGVGDLAEDEYYHVHLERPPITDGVQWYGDYIYTRDTTLLVEQSFLAPFHLPEEHGQANVDWWVRVVRETGEDENGKPVGVDIGLPSTKWYFVVEPRPDG